MPSFGIGEHFLCDRRMTIHSTVSDAVAQGSGPRGPDTVVAGGTCISSRRFGPRVGPRR